MPRPLRLIAVLIALAVAGSTGSCRSGGSAPVGAIEVTRGACGRPWHAGGGPHTFQIRNGDIVTTDVDLIDPRTGGVFAEVESLAPNTTRPMRVLLGQGDYAFACYPEDNDLVTGPTVHIASGGAGSPAVLPVDDLDLRGAVLAYRKYLTGGLATLARDARALAAAVNGGDRPRARGAWLTAHLAYARLGAAYGTFGDLAAAIDGLPDGHPGGVADPDFTGFHRLEYGLWNGQPLGRLKPFADRLAADVDQLNKTFSKSQIDPNDLPLRAHEIMENALQFQLTGAADQGSGTSLATALASLDGTAAVLDALAPVMRPRCPGWSDVSTWMAAARTALASAHTADGWTPVADLAVADRARIDASVGGLLEALAPIAAIGDVRRTS